MEELKEQKGRLTLIWEDFSADFFLDEIGLLGRNFFNLTRLFKFSIWVLSEKAGEFTKVVVFED